MYAISICNLQQSVAIDPARIEQVVRDALQSEQVVAAEISVALVNDERMHQLNRKHLGHDNSTDVLSFLLDCHVESASSADPHQPPGRGKRLDGEVVVCAETAAREAGRFGWETGDELLLYVVHGVLHLCGYDDASDADRERMRLREADILQIRGLTPNYR
jgi:probable rRNA maturation factor